MKLIHQVKEHWKKATLHLKRHHKKYIFWILSVSLLVKWISLIVAHTLVHNLSFANTVTWDNNDSIITSELDENNQNESLDEPTDDQADNTNNTDNTNDTGNTENSEFTENNNKNNEENDNTDITIPTKNDYEGNENNEKDDDENNEKWEESTSIYNETWTPTENENNPENNDDDEENLDDENNTNDEENPEEDLINNWKSMRKVGDWDCNEWDIEILSPTEWDIVWKTIDITRKFTNDDCKDHNYTVRLRNSNEQYLDIFEWNYNTTRLRFDSTKLISNYFTWHKIAVVSDEAKILYWNAEWWEFTIDNIVPTLSNIKVRYPTKNKKLNIWDTITISFESDKELTGVTVNILWQNALLEQKIWKKYTYTMDFSNKNTEWKVVYWINYSDKVGNTWYYEWYENIELDYTKPAIENFEMSYKWNNEIKLTYTTNEDTNSHLVYLLSWAKKTNSLDKTGKNNTFTIKNIKKDNIYSYSISIEDEAKNAEYIGGTFILSWNSVVFTKKEISKWNLITEIWFRTWNSWEVIDDIKKQYSSFDTCAKKITVIKLELPIKLNSMNVRMPKFSDEKINKLTNAFTVVLVQRLEKKDLSQKALDEISEDLNNFLIVIKLVKDDNNACKQNMTQYYINRFKKTLIKYWIIK